MKDLGNTEKNLKKLKLSFRRALLHPTQRDFCVTRKEVKLEPKVEELMLLNREIDNVAVFLSSSDLKADNTASASLSHNRFSWFGPTTLTQELFPIESVAAMSDSDSRILT